MALGVKDGWKTIWSPLLIFLLLYFVSGIPMTEELYKDDEEFKEWAKITSAFVPWPQKSISNN
jgi:steroid 5-alpha reductase family enzyme